MKNILLFVVLILLTVTSEMSSQSWQEMMDSCNAYQQAQDYQTALKWALQAEVKAKEEFGELDTNYAYALSWKPYLFDILGNYDSSFEYSSKLLLLSRKIFSSDHPFLIQRIGNMAGQYLKKREFDSAKSLFEEAINNLKKSNNSNKKDLSIFIGNLAKLFEEIYEYKIADSLYNEAITVLKNSFIIDENLAAHIGNLADLKRLDGNYIESESLYLESLEMFREIFKKDHQWLAISIGKLGYFYLSIGKYTEAEKLLIESFNMKKRIFSNDHPSIAASLNFLALFYDQTDDYQNAEKLYQESLSMRRRLFNDDNEDLAIGINNLANFYLKIGNLNKADSLFKEALILYRSIYKSDHPSLASFLNNMALFMEEKVGAIPEVENLYIESLNLLKRIYRADNSLMLSVLNSLANYYFRIGNKIKAKELFDNILISSKNIYTKKDPSLALNIGNVANFYSFQGYYNESEKLFLESKEIMTEVYQKESIYLATAILNLALLYNDHGKYAEAEPLFINTLNINRNLFNNQTYFLSEIEKKQFWKKLYFAFESFNTFATLRFKENPTILCNMYDTQLYTKALLLNSANKIKTRILNSGDSALINKFRTWSDTRQFLVKLYKMTNDELKKKNFDIDSIENVANNIEKEISLKSEEFKQSYERKNITWKSIQTMLKPDEAAVEIIRFRYFDKRRFTDTVYYAFLIVNDECIDHPEIIVLENGNELEGEAYNRYRKFIQNKIADVYSFDLYWSKVYEKLKGYKKVYISADGIYNKLNLSTLMMPDRTYLLDVQEIQQLNSTKDLLLGYYKKQGESNIYNSAVLIGNPNYELAEDKVKEASILIKKDRESDKYYEQIAGIRSTLLTKLPGTEKEVKSIEKFLKSRKWDVSSYLGDMALKTAVLTAKSPRVLHIATHGMFLEDVKRDAKELFGIDEFRIVENPLLRSGVFFTGANNYFKPDTILPINEDNGLLTAYEAMNLELDNTELVVLSACETGLGEIHNGEGVFGLRRAFQQAGAKSVLMSLWKVDDQATQELMTQFYKNWVIGLTKREAFKKAQQYIKDKFPAPYYWGAFVMVGE